MSGNKKTIEVKLQQVDYLFKNLPSAIVAILAISSVVFLTLDGVVDENSLNIWYFLSLLFAFFRFILYFVYKKSKNRKDSLNVYYILYFMGVLGSGLLWSASAFMIFPSISEYQMLLIIMVGGLSSGSTVSVASRIEMFYSYLTISLLPILYVYITTSDSELAYGLTLSVLVFMLLLIVIAKRISMNVNNYILLSIENAELLYQQEQKTIEANRANEAKSKFLSVMSHEIRTPLNAIIGFIKILKKDEKDSNKIKYLDTIDKSSYILLNVLNDILDLTKIESGKFTIEATDFSPKEEFDSLYELFIKASEEKGVNFIKSISDDLPRNIRCDKLRVDQITSNLISNAIKFTPKDKNVELIVRFNKEKSSLYVEVKDDGIGISKENIDKILEDFTQADSSICRKYGGTGLGLSISTKLLELLDSELHVKSEFGKGSSFSFELLVDVIEKSIENKYRDIEVDFLGKKVLVAEDNKTNQMLIKILLDDMNLNVSIANDGMEAEDMFKKDSFDIVFMDINMPNKNGIEAMDDIKNYEKNLGKNIPVVALTANSVSGDREKYIQDGFDDYISKPIEHEELVKVLQKYL